MLLIPCPYCGQRDESEFVYGGPKRTLPLLDGQAGHAVWQKALHQIPNPRGPIAEIWYHSSGCESWIEVIRDTVTHEISGGEL